MRPDDISEPVDDLEPGSDHELEKYGSDLLLTVSTKVRFKSGSLSDDKELDFEGEDEGDLT